MAVAADVREVEGADVLLWLVADCAAELLLDAGFEDSERLAGVCEDDGAALDDVAAFAVCFAVARVALGFEAPVEALDFAVVFVALGFAADDVLGLGVLNGAGTEAVRAPLLPYLKPSTLPSRVENAVTP